MRTIHTQFCERDADFGPACLRSALKALDIGSICINLHRGISTQTRSELETVAPYVEICEDLASRESLQEHLARYPACQRFRDSNPYAIKLFDIPLLSECERIVYTDADILFTRDCRKLAQFNQAPFLFPSHGEYPIESALKFSNVLRKYKLPFVYPFCAGFYVIDRSSYDLEFVEWFLRRDAIIAELGLMTEQIIWSVMACQNGLRQISNVSFPVGDTDFDFNIVSKPYFAVHFLGPNKDLLRREIFLQNATGEKQLQTAIDIVFHDPKYFRPRLSVIHPKISRIFRRIRTGIKKVASLKRMKPKDMGKIFTHIAKGMFGRGGKEFTQFRLWRIMPLCEGEIVDFDNSGGTLVRARRYGKNLFFPVRIHKFDDYLVFDEVVIKDEYRTLLQLLPKVFGNDKPRFAIDAGANVGYTSALLAAVLPPNSRIVAVEPDDENFSVLDETALLNRCNVIIPHKGVLWNRESVEFELVSGFRTGGSCSLRFQPAAEFGGQTVKSATIESVCAQYHIPRVDVLKLDIEGAEAELFRCKSFLTKSLPQIPCVAIEVHEEFVGRAEIEAALGNAGFSIFTMNATTFGFNRKGLNYHGT